MTTLASPSDRPFLFMAVGLSCLVHALILLIWSWQSGGFALPTHPISVPTTPFKLVYTDDADEALAKRALSRRIVIPEPSTLTGLATAGGTGSRDGRPALGGGDSWNQLIDRVAAAGAGGGASATVGGVARLDRDISDFIDLTDVRAAAQGDPVRLAYFSAIRAQVQRTADAQDWAANSAPDGGLVYVHFVIDRTGRIHSTAILPDRSQASQPLCDTAVRLIAASNPFPAFPPSFQETDLAVLLPIEFVSPVTSN